MSSFQSNRARLAPIVAAGLGIAYPFVVYLASDHLGSQIVLAVVGLLILARLGLSGLAASRSFLIIGVIGAVATGLLALFDLEQAPLFYPVFMNLGASAAFGISLFSSASLIETMARVYEPAPSAQAKVYMRKVTVLWCVFLAINAAVSLATVLQSDRALWLFYNGFLSYVLMGLLFAGEYLVRRHVKQRDPS